MATKVRLSEKLDPSNDGVYIGATATVTDGLSVYHAVSVSTGFDATSVKPTPGMLYGWRFDNADTAKVALLKFYNKASAPDPSADAALEMFEVRLGFAPAVGVTTASEWSSDIGIPFTTGIAFCITQNTGTGETAVDANDVSVLLTYK